ncbi:MAG: hypothetical protein ACI9J2_001582 [Saprospiraceae bacterium]|jgi:hypothetical protein
MKRALAVILYADVVGYSRLMGVDEKTTLERRFDCLSLLTTIIELHGGTKIKEAGDAILAEYTSAISGNQRVPSPLNSEVDHFFPHTLKHHGFSNIVDGIWNLVLSCQDCNRGGGGKFASIPTIRLLGRLHTRNEFLISSHHPLKETLIQQTGHSEKIRTNFLNAFHAKAWAVLIHTWEAKEKYAPYF